MAELAGYDLVLRQAPRRTLEHLARDLVPTAGDVASASFWCGLRPMTPDGPPVLGATRYRNLWLNTGRLDHGLRLRPGHGGPDLASKTGHRSGGRHPGALRPSRLTVPGRPRSAIPCGSWPFYRHLLCSWEPRIKIFSPKIGRHRPQDGVGKMGPGVPAVLDGLRRCRGRGQARDVAGQLHQTPGVARIVTADGHAGTSKDRSHAGPQAVSGRTGSLRMGSLAAPGQAVEQSNTKRWSAALLDACSLDAILEV
jgi:hypothetical protein